MVGEVALKLSKDLASYGVQIVSGLASGIDGTHIGVLWMHGGDTYGILGVNDVCYQRKFLIIYGHGKTRWYNIRIWSECHQGLFSFRCVIV